jgi:hypothetical protein
MKPEENSSEIPQNSTPAKNASWDAQYQHLVQFYQANSHTNVPRKGSTVNLSKWLTKQRSRKSKLSQEQVAKLDAVNFEWNSKKVLEDLAWNERYARLQGYLEEHGNTNVPQKYEPDLELGTWVANQRRRYNQGKLRADRQQLLQKLGFNFLTRGGKKPANPVINKAYDAQWERMFQQLVKFKNEHGHTNVVQNSGELGMWVSTQRRYFHKKIWIPGMGMREDRKEKLDSIGFEWTRMNKKEKSGDDGEAEEPPSKKLKADTEESSVAATVAAAVEEVAKAVEEEATATAETGQGGDAAVQAVIQDAEGTVVEL